MKPKKKRPLWLLLCLKWAAEAGLPASKGAKMVGITKNQAHQIARAYGFRFKGKKTRPRVTNPVRTRPRSGLSGQKHYDRVDAIQSDPFNRR